MVNINVQIFDNVFLFLPVSRAWVENWLREKFGKNYEKTHDFQIIEGSNGYVVLATEKGIAMGDEFNWAEDISNRLEQPLYSVWTHDEAEENIHKWKKGEIVESTWEDFFEFAEQMGVSLPGKPDPLPLPLHSLCLIEGVTKEQFSGETLEKFSYLQIVPNKIGTIFYGKERETYEIYYELLEMFPEALVYRIRVDHEQKIRIVVSRGWEDLGEIYIPPSELYKSTLKEIKGESEPAEIANALDIPLKFLGLEK